MLVGEEVLSADEADVVEATKDIRDLAIAVVEGNGL